MLELLHASGVLVRGWFYLADFNIAHYSPGYHHFGKVAWGGSSVNLVCL